MEFKPVIKKRTYNEAIGINQDYDILIKNNISINNISLNIDLLKCIIDKMIIKYNFY